MRQSLRSRLQCPLFSYLLTAGSISMLMAGCAGSPAPVTSLHQDARVAVYLENVADKSFRAAHPIKLDEDTVANALRGVHVEKKEEIKLLIGKALKNYASDNTRAFSEDDIEALTPHITAALAQAAPNQHIGFRLRYAPAFSPASRKTGAPSVETTAGYLFADGLSLHLTLTEFGPGKVYNPDTKKEPRELPDPIGLYDREVKFIPEAAMRPKSSDGLSWFAGGDAHTVAIDYQLMSKLLAAPPPPAPSAPGAAQPAPTATAPAATSDAELQTFKEQLKALQKKLEEQNAELQELKKSSIKKK